VGVKRTKDQKVGGSNPSGRATRPQKSAVQKDARFASSGTFKKKSGLI